MLVAQDFRNKARTALSGKWGLALGTCLVANLLGAGTYFLNSSSGSGSGGSFDEETITSLQEMPEEAIVMILGIVAVVFLVSLAISVAFFLLGGPITLGYVKFNLDLVDGKEARIDDLFSQFNRFGDGFLVQLLRRIYISLWTMLFFLPGIILGIVIGVLAAMSGASDEMVGVAVLVAIFVGLIPAVILGTIKEYSYAMAPYILYENTGMKANEAISLSKELMNGNKWRLFCLLFSFTGWALLSVFFSCGIGHLWLNPYMEASVAAFYREIYAEKYGRPYDYQQYEQPMNTNNPYETGSYF